MKLLFDILLILITSIISYRSLKLIAKYQSNSLADYAILLLYIFQTIPIICDLLIGVPKYSRWFIGMEEAITNEAVCIIYDVYIVLVNFGLYLVTRKSQLIGEQISIGSMRSISNKVPDYILFLLIASPAIHAICSGNIMAFLIYNSLSHRGFSADYTELNSVLVIIAILALIMWYFKKDASIPRLILFFVFSFIIIWISGKRYSVITIAFSFFYVYVMEKKTNRKRINIKAFLFIATAAVIIYSIFYIVSVRAISDSSFDSVYTMLRLDFGRDDVVKFSIWKEYICREHILDWPLQTVVSTILMIIPRAIFPMKGYPHYRYLTAAIYNRTIYNIPSGITPSILEMMISNFRIIGIPLCILFLCWYCKRSDKSRSGLQHYCYAMVMMGMLSQSMDSMILLFYIVLFCIIFGNRDYKIGDKRFHL